MDGCSGRLQGLSRPSMDDQAVQDRGLDGSCPFEPERRGPIKGHRPLSLAARRPGQAPKPGTAPTQSPPAATPVCAAIIIVLGCRQPARKLCSGHRHACCVARPLQGQGSCGQRWEQRNKGSLADHSAGQLPTQAAPPAAAAAGTALGGAPPATAAAAASDGGMCSLFRGGPPTEREGLWKPAGKKGAL